MATARLSKRGTMILPKKYRDALKLKAGTGLTLLRIGDGLILMPEQKRFEQLCEAIRIRLENAGITEADVQATLPEARERLARRRYPELFSSGERPLRKARAAKAKGKK